MLWGQTFDLSDLVRLGVLLLLEGMLSLDNALVLAKLVQRLPHRQRTKALFVGFSSAFVIRGLLLLLFTSFLSSPLLSLVGGTYLIYLGGAPFLTQRNPVSAKTHLPFLLVVLWIESTDLLFALDSLLTALALISQSIPQEPLMLHSKLWIVYVGGLVGMATVRFTSSLFNHLLDRFKYLERASHLAMIWIGMKLAGQALVHLTHSLTWLNSSTATIIFWLGIAATMVWGFVTTQQTTSS